MLRASNNAHTKNTFTVRLRLQQNKPNTKTPFVISYFNKFSNWSYELKVSQQLCHRTNSAHMEIILGKPIQQGRTEYFSLDIVALQQIVCEIIMKYNLWKITVVFHTVEDHHLHGLS